MKNVNVNGNEMVIKTIREILEENENREEKGLDILWKLIVCEEGRLIADKYTLVELQNFLECNLCLYHSSSIEDFMKEDLYKLGAIIDLNLLRQVSDFEELREDFKGDYTENELDKIEDIFYLDRKIVYDKFYLMEDGLYNRLCPGLFYEVDEICLYTELEDYLDLEIEILELN